MEIVEQLPTDVEALQHLLRQQTAFNRDLQTLLATTQQSVVNLELTISHLQNQIETLLRKLYGKKSERNDQMDDIENGSLPFHHKKSATPSISASNRNGRRELPFDLPRKKIIHDLPDDEKSCSWCGKMLARMGESITEQLEFIPATLIVHAHHRLKYACRTCGGNVKIAKLPPQPIDKGLPGPGLLAEVLVNKYEDALPLYRQEKRWQRLGIELPRSTLCDWVAQTAISLEPIVIRMKEETLLKSRKIHTDDTPIPVQAKGKNPHGSIVGLCGWWRASTSVRGL